MADRLVLRGLDEAASYVVEFDPSSARWVAISVSVNRRRLRIEPRTEVLAVTSDPPDGSWITSGIGPDAG